MTQIAHSSQRAQPPSPRQAWGRVSLGVAALALAAVAAMPTPALADDCFGEDYLRVGRAIYDITGPAAELGMMGYAMIEQKTQGIHMRLRSRAFVLESPCNNKRAVFVSADLGQVFQSVKQGVMQKLRARYGSLYTDENVMISAIHTHSGPGGYSHYALYNLTVLGFDKQNYDAIVNGIYQSIVRAHNNLRAASVRLSQGDLANAGFNRSSKAYDRNPAAERSRYSSNTDQTMTVLRLQALNGQQLGMISWFAVHPTNVGNKNRLITGDSKGLASYRFEQAKNTNYLSSDTFVAAFAQANEGDVSPNLWGVPDNVHDYQRAATIADRQYQKAMSLYNSGGTTLSGGIDYRHMYVKFADLPVAANYTGAGFQRTCAAAIGLSMLAGSTEDGPGLSFIPEGLRYDGVSWPRITLVPGDQKCHAEKVIAVSTGRMSPYPWTPEVLPVQIIRIGNLAVLGVPFECTTMCGRRLRELVLQILGPRGVRYAVIAGLSNAYAGYVATREEYGLQHYEGASTHFGPWTLAALQQQFARAAESMRDGTRLDPGPTPRNLAGKQMTLQTGVVFDDKPLFKSFGSVETNASSSYSRGQTARAVFWGGHPKNNLKIQSSFLYVDRLVGGSWRTVAYDWDPETTYEWKRSGIANSKVTVRWTIPAGTPAGTYRLRHAGHWKSGWTGRISSYTGKSRSFSVR